MGLGLGLGIGLGMGGRAPSRVMAPNAAPGLVICHDASVGGITSAGTPATVSAWADQVGSAHLLQANANYQPSLTTLNGISVPQLDYDAGGAVNKFMALAASKDITNRLHDGSAHTLICAYAIPSPAAANGTILATRAAAAGVSFLRNSDGKLRWYVRSNAGVIFDVTTAAAQANTAVITVRGSAATGVSVRVNGVQVINAAFSGSPVAVDSDSTFRLNVGQTTPAAAQQHMGLALYDSVLSDAFVAKLERYWGNRLGISL